MNTKSLVFGTIFKRTKIMKKVKSIFKKALAMMGENEVKAWGIGIK